MLSEKLASEGEEAQIYSERTQPPQGGHRKDRQALLGIPQKHFWVEAEGREIRNPHPVRRKKSPNPDEARGSRTLRQMSLLDFCFLFLFFCVFFFFLVVVVFSSSRQSHWFQWSLRKASHFLRRYQVLPDLIVLGFQLWPPLPDKYQSWSLRAWRDCQSCFCFSHSKLLVCGREKNSAPEAWPEGSTSCLPQSAGVFQDSAEVGLSRLTRCSWLCCSPCCSVSFLAHFSLLFS